MAKKKYVYLFTEGNANMRELLGGKGVESPLQKEYRHSLPFCRFPQYSSPVPTGENSLTPIQNLGSHEKILHPD